MTPNFNIHTETVTDIFYAETSTRGRDMSNAKIAAQPMKYMNRAR